MGRRILVALLLVCLCASRAVALPGTSNTPALRPWAQKFYPFSVRYRQQIKRQIHLSDRQPARSSSLAPTVASGSLDKPEREAFPSTIAPVLHSLLMRWQL